MALDIIKWSLNSPDRIVRVSATRNLSCSRPVSPQGVAIDQKIVMEVPVVNGRDRAGGICALKSSTYRYFGLSLPLDG